MNGTMQRFLPWFVLVALSLLCVFADYLLKRAGDSSSPLRTRMFWAGTATYALTAPGWVYVLRHFKFATVGAAYCVILVLMMAVVGVVAFRETLSPSEVLGIGLAVAALVLLSRFS